MTNLHSLLAAGFTGADLQNLMNEAAIFAARRDLKEISKEEIADALERIVAGPEKKGAVMSDHKKKLVAYHEVITHCSVTQSHTCSPLSRSHKRSHKHIPSACHL
jgi:ATP-dependent Zn protease